MCATRLTKCMADKVVAYAIDWKTIHKPGEWERYSVLYTDPKKAVSSYEAAQKNPTTLELRCIKRIVTEKEISFEELLAAKPENMSWEMEVHTPRECFGYSGYLKKNK